MLIIRAISENDLEAIYALATQTAVGLTTLPADREILRQRCEESRHSFARVPQKPGDQQFLFVLEDLTNKLIVGTSAIVAKVGGYEPFYTYRVETTVKESKTLNVHKEIQFLQLVANHNGPSEIGTLFLHPEYRHSSNGRLLSLCRFLFMAQYPDSFEAEVVAELRGRVDTDGRAVFWEALGRHFFDVDYAVADQMVMKDKSFIADLMPRHPIYIPLLPKAAQEVIGEVHEHTIPARVLLEKEGFTFKQEVDIFEAGPLWGCAVADVRTVRESRVQTVSEIADAAIESKEFMVASVATPPQFRVCVSTLRINAQGVALPRETATALGVSVGDPVRYVPLRA